MAEERYVTHEELREVLRDALREVKDDIVRLRDRETMMSGKLEAMRRDFSETVQRMHQDNIERFDDMKEDNRELKLSVKTLNIGMTTLMADRNRVEGGMWTLRALTSGPMLKFAGVLGALGLAFSQVTPARLEMVRVWLFGT